VADKADGNDEKTALAAEGEEEALLGLPADGDDAPAPETGLHALGQLGTAVVVVACLVGLFLVVALVWGRIFR
jgi:hypothetical protein